jgi:hypothetical protein
MKNNNNSSKNINLNETHEEQVMRVLREMVSIGEVNTTNVNGVEYFSLTPEVTAAEKARRSAVAKKAWATRKRTMQAKTGKTSQKTIAVKHKENKDMTALKLKRIAAAHKAVATRRLNMKNKTTKTTTTVNTTTTCQAALKAKRVAAAHKAVATRHANTLKARRSAAACKAAVTCKLKARKAKLSVAAYKAAATRKLNRASR